MPTGFAHREGRFFEIAGRIEVRNTSEEFFGQNPQISLSRFAGEGRGEGVKFWNNLLHIKNISSPRINLFAGGRMKGEGPHQKFFIKNPSPPCA